MDQKSVFARWRANFVTGLIIVLPAVVSVAVVKWLFVSVSTVTDLLLSFVPRNITHEELLAHADGKGPMYWYWSLVAFVLGILLISAVGRLARNYFGKKTIEWVE